MNKFVFIAGLCALWYVRPCVAYGAEDSEGMKIKSELRQLNDEIDSEEREVTHLQEKHAQLFGLAAESRSLPDLNLLPTETPKLPPEASRPLIPGIAAGTRQSVPANAELIARERKEIEEQIAAVTRARVEAARRKNRLVMEKERLERAAAVRERVETERRAREDAIREKKAKRMAEQEQERAFVRQRAEELRRIKEEEAANAQREAENQRRQARLDEVFKQQQLIAQRTDKDLVQMLPKKEQELVQQQRTTVEGRLTELRRLTQSTEDDELVRGQLLAEKEDLARELKVKQVQATKMKETLRAKEAEKRRLAPGEARKKEAAETALFERKLQEDSAKAGENQLRNKQKEREELTVKREYLEQSVQEKDAQIEALQKGRPQQTKKVELEKETAAVQSNVAQKTVEDELRWTKEQLKIESERENQKLIAQGVADSANVAQASAELDKLMRKQKALLEQGIRLETEIHGDRQDALNLVGKGLPEK